jgi:predicted transcriptional regulator
MLISVTVSCPLTILAGLFANVSFPSSVRDLMTVNQRQFVLLEEQGCTIRDMRSSQDELRAECERLSRDFVELQQERAEFDARSVRTFLRSSGTQNQACR